MLEQQIHNQEMKDSRWKFDKINSLKEPFHKNTEINGSSYNKSPLKSSAILNIPCDDNYCFIWSIPADLQPAADSKTKRSSKKSTKL